jgi:hypothetical protein
MKPNERAQAVLAEAKAAIAKVQADEVKKRAAIFDDAMGTIADGMAEICRDVLARPAHRRDYRGASSHELAAAVLAKVEKARRPERFAGSWDALESVISKMRGNSMNQGGQSHV